MKSTASRFVKPMATKLRHIRMFSGNTILGDGSVIMIIDPNGIGEALGSTKSLTADAGAGEAAQEVSDKERMSVLVFRAGSHEQKAVPLSLVTRLEEIDASKIELANGRHLIQYRGQLMRAAVELAKDWRTDKYLRNLEALMIVADAETMLILTGNGDVLEPEGGSDGTMIAGIGSGGNYALAAARALADYEGDAEKIARRAMEVAAEVCVFTNNRLTVETI